MEEGFNVDSIYLDFSKAFDKVDLGILCWKLKKMGIQGQLGVWLHNFLKDRKQIIIANGAKSSESKVISGVPQGTVLGPLLFLIMINDIDDNVINSSVKVFADDTRITKAVKTEEEAALLQEDLETLYTWAKNNNMAFNGSKFEVLRLGKNQELKDNTNYLTPEAEDLIEVKDVLRDLGIMVNDKANFEDHIDKVCAQVNQKAGWILRTFTCRRTWFMKLMWKTLVQGHIDYCSQLYQPIQTGQLQRIENLQKSFTKKIPEMKNINYWERLKCLRLNSQQRRFERYRIIYTWKILEESAPNCGIKEIHSFEDRQGRKCELPNLKGSQSVKTLREQSFQVHGPRLFNSLPRYIRNLTKCGIDIFKEKLDLFLEKIPDQPKVGDLMPATCNQVSGQPSNSLVDQIREHQRSMGGQLQNSEQMGTLQEI